MKKQTLLLGLLLAAGLTSSRAQDTWTQKADFGGGGRFRATGFSIGSKGFLGTGYVFKDFWEYEPVTNAWTQKADVGGTEREAAVGFSIGSKGYIGTGYVFTLGNTRDFWEYDPVTNAWTQKADFGGTTREAAVGFSIGSKGYIGTGYDTEGPDVKDFWEYDLATNAGHGNLISEALPDWGQPDSLSEAKAMLEPEDEHSLDLYDPATNVWTQKADFGGQRQRGDPSGHPDYEYL